MYAHKTTINQAITWIASAWRLFRKQPVPWLGMTLIYVVVALLLKQIPFMGDLVLILITPLMLAGALLTARSMERPAANGAIANETSPSPEADVGSNRRDALLAHALKPVRLLFQAFTSQEKVLVVVVVCILTLGLAMVVKIVEYFLVGGFIVSGLTVTNLGTTPSVSVLLGMLAVSVLYVLLVMGLFYIVHLTMLGNHDPMSAIADSFSACLRNAWPLAVFTTAFVIPYAVIESVFSALPWLGYALVLSFGLLIIPVFVIGTYYSYKDIFESQPLPSDVAPV